MAHAGESRFWAAYGRALANPMIGCPVSLAVLAVNIALILSSRMWAQSLETSVEKLWVNPTSEAGRNLNYTNRWAQDAQGSEVELITMRDPVPGVSAATYKHVNNMYAVTKRVRDFVVTVNGTDYTTLDLCAGRAALPSYVAGCSAYSIMDYFNEGREYASDQGMAQFLLDSRLAYPATSYHLAWAATADVLQGGGYTFGKLFDDQCVTNGYLFCHEKPTYTLPSPYNVNTVGVGKGALFNQVYELASLAALPDQIRFEAAFIKAKGVLAGMMQQSRDNLGPAGGCTDWTTAANTQVPAASNLPTDWSLAACGYGSSGTCLGNTCTIAQLTTLKTGDFSSSCGKCVGALMFWLRDYTNNKMVSAANPHPGSAVPIAGPLFKWAVYTAPADVPATTKPAQLDLFNFGSAAASQFRLCPDSTPDSVLKRVKLPQCLGMWVEAYNARKLYAAGSTDAFFSRMTNEFRAWATLTTPAPTTLSPVAYYDFSNDTLDGIALMDSTTNTTKTARDTAWRSVIAADLVSPVRTIFNRHYNRASFKNATDKAIINTLSGVNNDFSILQNATRIVFGKPQPDPNLIRGGQCQCKPGYSGDRCKVPVDDGVCDCGSDSSDLFPRSCTTDAVGKCIPFASCAGSTEFITRILTLQATLFPQLDTSNLNNGRAAAVGLAADYYRPRETDAQFRSYCEAQLPCFENAPGSYPAFLPPTFAPVLTDAGYFTAHSRDLKDYPTIAFQWRAEQLLRLVNFNQSATGANIRSALNAVLPGLVAGDDTNLGTCTLGSNCNMGVSLTTPFASGSSCPTFTSGTITTLLDYMSCVVDKIHGGTVVGNLNPRNAQGVALWSNAGGSKTCSFSNPVVDSGYFTASVCNSMIANRAAGALWKLLDKGTIRVSALVSGLSAEPTDMTFDMYYNATLAWGTRMSGEWTGAVIKNQAPPSSSRRTAMENIINTYVGGDLTSRINTYLNAQCDENSNKYPKKLMNLAGKDCGTLYVQLPDATNTLSTSISAPAKLNITVSLVKYKLVGVVLGSCTMDAYTKLRGGATCFTDVDCNGPTGGTCVGLENNRTYDSIAAFGWIMFTRSLKGLQALNYDGVDQQRYREIANRPILDRYYAANPNLTRSTLNLGAHTLSPEAIKAVQAAWHVKLAELVAKSDNIDGTLTTALSTATVSDVVAQYSEADFRLIVIGYFLMILYAVLSLSSPSSNVKAMLINSRGMVAGAGIVLIAISVASGLGVTALAGYKWSAAATQILPYVMLGLGVNDVFVICRTFPVYREGLSPEDAAAQGIGMVGNAVFLVNFTNSCIFAIAILTGMPVIVVMAVQACIITVANFVTELAILPFLLAMDYRRQGSGRIDCIPCGPSIASKEELLGMSAAVASKDSEGRVARNCFNTCCVPRYASLILSKPMKVVVVVVMMGLLVAGAAGVGANVQLGLSLADLAPSGSQLQKSLEIRDSLFPFYTFYVAFPEVDYSDREVQQGMYELVGKVNDLGKVMDDSGITWIKAMILWGLPTGLPNYDLTTNERPCDIASPTTQGNCGAKFNCVIQFTHPSVYDEKKNPFFAKADFYRCLNKWLNTDSNYASLSPGFVLKDPTAPRGQREVYFSTNDTTGQKLPYSQTTFFAQGLNTNDDFVTLIHQTSLITGATTTPPSYAGGSPIAYWDQYVSLKGLINQSIGLGLAICFVVVSCTVIFTADFTGGRERVRRVIFIGIWTGALVTGTVCATVYTLYGFMTYADLKISSIPAISIIMSLGADLSFAAYIAMSFLNFSGTRDERVRGALDVMLAPALDGGVTILLGVVLLAFSPLLFIVRYFFLVWLLIVVFGLSFSFIALPVALSLVGPPSLVLERSEDLKA